MGIFVSVKEGELDSGARHQAGDGRKVGGAVCVRLLRELFSSVKLGIFHEGFGEKQ
ncbi:hypothetical protein SDC9_74855 [bioreactor metagenome]|uniref:Uncharacterized protein n=1 Tax=bioreactor metagenome TaxID=1076179 RepID=A0A644YQE8_9ZZZZ